ncbi:MAG: 3-isopropylmalate dehydratase small subunit [Bacteroidota bacterium]
MSHFPPIESRLVPLLMNDIDTDQIIPARFLKATDKSGMGGHLFADWRYQADGSPQPEFVLNKAEFQGAQILLAGNNFGCGSSREHAAWALRGFGFRAVMSESFADIFRNNALKNAVLPVEVSRATYQNLVTLTKQQPFAELTVDLSTQTVTLPDGETSKFPIDAFSKYCLLNGVDELGYLQKFEDKINAYENSIQK